MERMVPIYNVVHIWLYLLPHMNHNLDYTSHLALFQQRAVTRCQEGESQSYQMKFSQLYKYLNQVLKKNEHYRKTEADKIDNTLT